MRGGRPRRPSPRPDADEQLLRSTSRRLGLQAALLVAAAVVLLAGLAAGVVLRAQHSQTDQLLRQAVSRADDVGDPPAGAWLVVHGASGQQASPGLPRGLPEQGAIERVTAGAGPLISDLHVGGREYRVRTERRGPAIVQAALDLRSAHAERTRLVTTLFATGAAGLILAGMVGLLLARRAVRPLAEALALQRRFVADASHELRTPLTLLSTRTQLLRRSLDRFPLPEEILQDADGVVGDTARLGAVIDDLLLAADPRSDSPTGPVDVDALIAEAVAAARQYAAERGIALVEHSDSADHPTIAVGSPVALRRAVLALVDNAIEHTTPGGTVTVAAAPAGRRQVTLAVSDTGPGFDPAQHGHVFSRFASGGHSAARRRYGLGLALVREIAARHGGTVSVQSAPGRGTTLTLILPAGPLGLAEPSVGTPERGASTAQPGR